MGGWFATRPLSPGVTLITEPHVHPEFRANLYRIEGRDFDIQLDFGMGVRSLSGEVDFGARPVLAIASHAHVDHVGSFHEYGRRAGHVLEAEIFASMDDAYLATAWFAGLPEPFSQAPHGDWSPERYRIEPAPLTEYLGEGDVVDLGDRRFSVLHLPGHSPGCIGLLDEQNGEFFSADAIYDDALYDDLPHSSVEDYVKTMRRLLDLDVRVVHGGHGPSFDRARLREVATAYIRSKGG